MSSERLLAELVEQKVLETLEQQGVSALESDMEEVIRDALASDEASEHLRSMVQSMMLNDEGEIAQALERAVVDYVEQFLEEYDFSAAIVRIIESDEKVRERLNGKTRAVLLSRIRELHEDSGLAQQIDEELLLKPEELAALLESDRVKAALLGKAHEIALTVIGEIDDTHNLAEAIEEALSLTQDVARSIAADEEVQRAMSARAQELARKFVFEDEHLEQAVSDAMEKSPHVQRVVDAAVVALDRTGDLERMLDDMLKEAESAHASSNLRIAIKHGLMERLLDRVADRMMQRMGL